MIVIKTLHQVALMVLAVILQSVFMDTSQHEKVIRTAFYASGGAFIVAVIHVLFKGMCPTPVDSILLFLRLVVTISKTFLLFVKRGCTTKFPTWSLRFELLHTVLHTISDTYGHRMILQQHAHWIRLQSDVVGSILGWFSCCQHNRRHEAVQFNGLEHIWLRNKQCRSTEVKRLVVLYLHGGGYAVLSPRFYISLGAELASTIEKELGKLDGNNHQVDLLLGNYRKAPEFRFPTQPKDAVSLYADYLVKGEGLAPHRSFWQATVPVGASSCPFYSVYEIRTLSFYPVLLCFYPPPSTSVGTNRTLRTASYHVQWLRLSAPLTIHTTTIRPNGKTLPRHSATSVVFRPSSYRPDHSTSSFSTGRVLQLKRRPTASRISKWTCTPKCRTSSPSSRRSCCRTPKSASRTYLSSLPPTSLRARLELQLVTCKRFNSIQRLS